MSSEADCALEVTHAVQMDEQHVRCHILLARTYVYGNGLWGQLFSELQSFLV